MHFEEGEERLCFSPFSYCVLVRSVFYIFPLVRSIILIFPLARSVVYVWGIWHDRKIDTVS